MKILYEDKDILVVDKPSGMVVHKDAHNIENEKEKTVTAWVLKNYPKMKNVGEPMKVEYKKNTLLIPRPGVVHRLDRDTSGVLILAKTKKAYDSLKEQFQNRKIRKIYNTIVSGEVKIKDNKEFLRIDKSIGRSPSDFRRWLAGRGAKGTLREAVTLVKVLNVFEIGKNKYSFLEVHPETGRTHQIRVHMKYVNHPVICDSLYNPKGICPKGLDRLALHARSIEFENMKGEKIKVESPLPKEFEKLLKQSK